VAFDLIDQLTSCGLVDAYTVGDTDENLVTVRSEADCPYLIRLVGLWGRLRYLFSPLNERAHI